MYDYEKMIAFDFTEYSNHITLNSLMSSLQVFFNHKFLWQHLEESKSCFVEMELKIPPAYE